jgi:hypothetical protein
LAPFAQTTLPAHLKPGLGRPSEYRPEYCQLVIEQMGQGLSLTAFAGSILVARDTVYGWISAHRDFSDAVARARAARTLWLEQKLLKSRKGAETTAAMFALRNAQPDEWKDVRSVQHQHSLEIKQLSDAELNRIAAGYNGDAGSGVIDGSCERVDPQHPNGR